MRAFLVGTVVSLALIGWVATSIHASTSHRKDAVVTAPIVVGKPLGVARLTAAEAVNAVKAQNDGVLFTYAKSIVTNFGSYNLGLTQQNAGGGRIQSSTKDYWLVTLTGLNKDNRGNYLLVGSGGLAAHPVLHVFHNVTFVVDDSSGKVVEFPEW
ncbi:MAG: hypothetical protein ACRDFX_09390 [Chloroflexota bacterium]